MRWLIQDALHDAWAVGFLRDPTRPPRPLPGPPGGRRLPRLPGHCAALGRPGRPARTRDGLRADNAKDRYFLADLRDHGAKAFPTSVAFVRRLRAAGLRTAAVPAGRNMVAVLASARLRGLFDAEVDGVEADRLGLAGKPDLALFLEAARRLQVAQARRSRTPRPGWRRATAAGSGWSWGGPGRPGRRPGRAWRRPGRGRPGQLTLAPAVTPRGER